MEHHVVLTAREQDYGLVEGAIEKACAEFKAELGQEVSVSIDKEHPLPAESCGGVMLGSSDWRIKCANTLESRLELLQDQMLPEIRTLVRSNPDF